MKNITGLKRNKFTRNRKLNLPDIIKKHNLPDRSKFCGFAVHLPTEDEFLAGINETEEIVVRAFTKSPGFAKLYRNYNKVVRDAKNCLQATKIVFVFDEGPQFAVITIE